MKIKLDQYQLHPGTRPKSYVAHFKRRYAEFRVSSFFPLSLGFNMSVCSRRPAHPDQLVKASSPFVSVHFTSSKLSSRIIPTTPRSQTQVPGSTRSKLVILNAYSYFFIGLAREAKPLLADSQVDLLPCGERLHS